MRYFTDRDMGTYIGTALRGVGIEVQLYRERYTSGLVPDTQWVREVTEDGYVIVTKDTHIRSRPAERGVFEDAGALAVVLATRGATRALNLRALLIALPRLEVELASGEAPQMWGIDRAGSLTRYIPVVDRGRLPRSR